MATGNAREALRSSRDNILAFAAEEADNDDFREDNPATNLLRATHANFRERPAPEQVPRGKQICHQTDQPFTVIVSLSIQVCVWFCYSTMI